MNNKIKIGCGVLLVPLLFTVEAQASIYKCVKANSDVYYNDKPCPVNDAETKLKSIKDPVGGYIPPAFVEDKASPKTFGKSIGNDVVNNLDANTKGSSGSQKVNGSGSADANKTSGAYDGVTKAPNSENQVINSSNSNSSSNNQSLSGGIKIDPSLKLNIMFSEKQK